MLTCGALPLLLLLPAVIASLSLYAPNPAEEDGQGLVMWKRLPARQAAVVPLPWTTDPMEYGIRFGKRLPMAYGSSGLQEGLTDLGIRFGKRNNGVIGSTAGTKGTKALASPSTRPLWFKSMIWYNG